jgi:transposase
MLSAHGLSPRKATGSMVDDDLWQSIRLLYYRQKKSKSWIARELQLSRNTVSKYIAEAEPPKYKLKEPRGRPLCDKWEEHVRAILAEDQDAPRKQHHTAGRIYKRLTEEFGYTGSDRTIRKLVASIRNNAAKNVFVPLIFEPGKDAQVDYGESYAYLDNKLTKLYGFEMRLNYSRRKFVMFFRSPNTESFLEGHMRAFDLFGGVPERISYDNLGIAVSHVGKGKQRRLTKSFKQLAGYYAFEGNFCTPGKEGAHEKGGVESSIGFSRRNWMVPVPRFATLEDLNEYVLQKCIADGDRVVAGQKQSINASFDIEKQLLLPLPPAPFDTGVRKSGSVVDSYQTIAFDKNRYSVPTEYIGKPLWFKSYWNKVQIGTGSEIITEHLRTYEEEEYVLKPEHYFDLLERRPQAVAYARPILQVQWPDEYWQFFNQVRSMFGSSRAGRDFVRILRCHAQYGMERTVTAIREATTAGAVAADVVLQILDREKFTDSYFEPPLDISSRPELANITVALTDTAEYQQLLGDENGQRVA